MKEKTLRLNTEMLQALLEGKKLVFDNVDQRITIITDRYGVFMTHEKMVELRRRIGFQALADTDGFFREVFGDDLAELIFDQSGKRKAPNRNTP